MSRVLITGCSSGIGRETALELTRRGHDVIATARRVETLADIDCAARLALDVTDEASVAAAMEQAGEVDALVNNAAWNVSGPVEHVPLEPVRRMFDVNVFGAARMMQAVAPGMRAQRRGVIVNLSSIAGRVGQPLGGYYCASKFALEALSESAKFELSHWGIRIVIIEPGYIESKMAENAVNYGSHEPPWDELENMWVGGRNKLGANARPGPDIVAVAIADAIEQPETPLRVPVGEDADLVLSARSSMNDADFEAAMRSVLNLDW
jgi:NAD(P)-dependent dehydrogenase (short-subunit alcohol dehydrogenase family)